jgi:hypothetical protein
VGPPDRTDRNLPYLAVPDGRLPSPRWRAWAWLCAIATSRSFVAILIAPGSFADAGYPNIRKPLGIEALRPMIGVLFLVIVLIPISIVGCAVGLIQRFRRSGGQERLQLKWLAAAASVVATGYAVLFALHLPFGLADGDTPHWVDVVGNFVISLFVLIPLAIAVAILKYRLYDIDLIINRTVVYACLTAVLALVYVGGVVGVGGVLRSATAQEDNLVVAGPRLLWRPCSAPPALASVASSTGASTGASTTRSKPWRASRRGSETRSTSRPCPPSLLRW